MFTNRKYRKSYNDVKTNFNYLSKEKTEKLREVLQEKFFSDISDDSNYLSTEIGKKDMDDHVSIRLENFRNGTIPWLNSILSLDGADILEVGSGTGCSTVAFAEQGANVTGIDLSEQYLEVARERCNLYGLSADFSIMNAENIQELGRVFDIVIFTASLEHMIYEERISSIKAAWSVLKTGGYLVVIDTPNRLHYYDRHSSMLPFFNWLPDEIAVQYSKFSSREKCVAISNSGDLKKLIRFGRGVSFHEFELALDCKCNEMLVYDMQSFINTTFTKSLRYDTKYIKLLKRVGPNGVPEGFCYDDLFITIRKYGK